MRQHTGALSKHASTQGTKHRAIDSAWRPRYFNSFHPWHVAAPAQVGAKEAVPQHIYELTP
jgi:hypothetical protein